MKETVMLFNVEDSNLLLNTEMALFPHGVHLLKVDKSKFNLTLGEILGISKEENEVSAYTGDESFSPMLVFVNIPDKKLDLILKSLRSHQAIFPYKAVLTPTNVKWTPLACLEELKLEHEAIKNARKK